MPRHVVGVYAEGVLLFDWYIDRPDWPQTPLTFHFSADTLTVACSNMLQGIAETLAKAGRPVQAGLLRGHACVTFRLETRTTSK